MSAYHKILPVKNERWTGRSKTKNAANHQKWLAAVLSGVPGQIRTAGLSLRRRTLYPAELQRRISKLFNYPAQKDSNELPLRRRTLYPAELRKHIKMEGRTRTLGTVRLISYPISGKKSSKIRNSSCGGHTPKGT